MASGCGVDRRRAGSIGMEERALSTLEKFVELCDKGDDIEEVDDHEDPEKLLDSLDDNGNKGEVGSGEHNTRKSASAENLSTKPRRVGSARAKLCELFIDPSLVAMKTTPDETTGDSKDKANGKRLAHSTENVSTNSSSTTKTKDKPKKSEEIWVRRITSGRRSFRITNFRGQQLPSILTEDVDEGDETNEASVTTWTSGTKNPLKLFDHRGRHRSGGSGDDYPLTAGKPSRGTSLMDVFRPRSKSDAQRLKKPTFLSSMKNAMHMGSGSSTKESSPDTTKDSHRPRSGSESLRSPVAKVMDIFRTRSQSVNASDDKRKKHSGSSSSWAPQGGRRSSVNFHRSSDANIDSAHAAILFRDARGLPHVDPFLDRHLIFGEHEENEILVKFFKFHKCYDLIPTSAKLVVFDTQLLVKKAFFALVYNGVRAAPLWDSTERKIVGMLTITDFIRVLHAMYYDSAGSTGKMSELEEHRVETWRKRFLLNRQPLVYIDPDSSLYEAICSLVNNRIHRLPVIDKHTGNVLHILTHKRILKFLFLYINEIPRPSFLNKQLREVKIGSFEKVETAREDTPIIVALQKFLDRRVSALPIVDEENRLLSIYARFDVINLAAEKTYSNLDITLKQANEHRNEWFEGVHKCTLDETLFVVMDRIVKAEVHRLVVVDEKDRVTGVISLSDILQYLVMRPEIKEIGEVTIKKVTKEKTGEEIVFEAHNGLILKEVKKIDTQNDSSVSPVNGKSESNDQNDNDAGECSEEEHPTIFEEDEKHDLINPH